jgi:hypothetical protein
MKYSLRSLTLFCVLLGGRIEYLRRMAAHHERELLKSSGQNEILNHAFAAAQFHQAVLRPWTIVDDSPRRFPNR